MEVHSKRQKNEKSLNKNPHFFFQKTHNTENCSRKHKCLRFENFSLATVYLKLKVGNNFF